MSAAQGRTAGWMGGGPQTAEEMIAEARKAFFVMLGFMVLIWGLQLANWAGGYRIDQEFQIVPKHVGSLGEIFTAPFLHYSWQHIESNSGPLFVFGFLAAYRGVLRFLLLTLLVVVTSGVTVWVFQSGAVGTVGASGLVFGYFAYVALRGIFDRHLIDTLIGVVMAGSFAYMLSVAVPGTPGVSWLDHIGGMVGGVVGAWLLRDRRPKPVAAGKAVAGTPGGTGTPGATGANLPAQQGQGGGAADPSRSDLHKELGDLGLL
jgi:membrane associated rhomboid family serine protease